MTVYQEIGIPVDGGSNPQLPVWQDASTTAEVGFVQHAADFNMLRTMVAGNRNGTCEFAEKTPKLRSQTRRGKSP